MDYDAVMMNRLIPKVFFNHMSEGLDLFVGCLGFKVLHQDESLAVVARDEAKAYVVESPEFAAKDRPEITIETDSIEAPLRRDCSQASGDAPSEFKGRRKKAMGRERVCGSRQDRCLHCFSSMVTTPNHALQRLQLSRVAGHL